MLLLVLDFWLIHWPSYLLLLRRLLLLRYILAFCDNSFMSFIIYDRHCEIPMVPTVLSLNILVLLYVHIIQPTKPTTKPERVLDWRLDCRKRIEHLHLRFANNYFLATSKKIQSGKGNLLRTIHGFLKLAWGLFYVRRKIQCQTYPLKITSR